MSEEYYMELRQGVLQYYGVSTSELLEHIFTNYTKIDDTLLIKNKRDFEEPPYLIRPIAIYFKKQEECQRLAADGEIPISEAEMVMQVQTHLGATGLINTKYLAWKKKAVVERKWVTAKKYFRTAIIDVDDLNKLTTGKEALTANAVIADKNTDQQVCEEMVEKLREYLDTLTMAATKKKHHQEPDQDDHRTHQQQLRDHCHHQEAHQPTREGSCQEQAKRQNLRQ